MTTTAATEYLITTIRQIDGSTRRIYAANLEDAGKACRIIRDEPAMIDHLGALVSRIEDVPKRAKRIEITMSERRPLKIDPEQWPVVASADWFSGQIECQANTIRRIKVREHDDGRRIVYGFQCAGNGGQAAGTRNPSGGFLVDAVDGKVDEAETVRAIRRVGGIIEDDGLADDCIADLPAEEV